MEFTVNIKDSVLNKIAKDCVDAILCDLDYLDDRLMSEFGVNPKMTEKKYLECIGINKKELLERLREKIVEDIQWFVSGFDKYDLDAILLNYGMQFERGGPFNKLIDQYEKQITKTLKPQLKALAKEQNAKAKASEKIEKSKKLKELAQELGYELNKKK